MFPCCCTIPSYYYKHLQLCTDFQLTTKTEKGTQISLRSLLLGKAQIRFYQVQCCWIPPSEFLLPIFSNYASAHQVQKCHVRLKSQNIWQKNFVVIKTRRETQWISPKMKDKGKWIFPSVDLSVIAIEWVTHTLGSHSMVGHHIFGVPSNICPHFESPSLFATVGLTSGVFEWTLVTELQLVLLPCGQQAIILVQNRRILHSGLDFPGGKKLK